MKMRALSAWAMSAAAVLGLCTSAHAAPPFDAFTPLDSIPADHAQLEEGIRPEAYNPFEVDLEFLRAQLAAAPMEGTAEAREHPLFFTIPAPDGSMQRFRVWESPVYEAGLQEHIPDVRTYGGQGIDDPAASIRFDVTQLGFHVQVLTPSGSWYIDPWSRGDSIVHTSYFKSDLLDVHAFECHGAVEVAGQVREIPRGGTRASGADRKEYRLANAATGEYTDYHSTCVPPCAADGQAAIVTAINRINGVYELEVAVRMILVANNINVVYTNGATDPYTNNDGGTMLGQNRTNLNAVIGSGNYDIGHVFSTGGGGVAGLGVVCGTNKAWGVTGLNAPTGDAFYIDYVAHEMGHQYAANHSFNCEVSSCGGGNRSGADAYEVGSGSTIMSYAGICGNGNLQTHSDAYFIHNSYDEIRAFVASGTGNNCDVLVNTGNGVPTVNAGADYTIPIGTPFALTATGSDPDGDTVTYCWEERDLGIVQNPTGGVFPDNGDSPFLRSWTATTNPTRTVPRLSNLLANTFAKGEQYPATTRLIAWRVTIRDGRAGSGGVNTDNMNLNTTTAAGPFLVTAPNTAVTWSGVQTVTWNVAGTTANGVNCANVKISLSTDGGNTFPTVLNASTPNDGSESVTLPSISTSQARIKVEAVGNIFFDLSNVNFTITPGSGPPNTPTSVTATPSTICQGQTSSLTASVGSGEVVDWYTGSCGGTFVGTGSPLVVSPTSNTTYFARARRTSDGQVSAACGSTSVTVNPLPTAPSSASSDRSGFCTYDADTITLSAVGGSGTSLRWYSSSCGGTFVGLGNNLVIASPTATTTYFARWENSCGNSLCASVTVNVAAACRTDWNQDCSTDAFDYDDYASAYFDYVNNGVGFPDYNNDGEVDAFDYDDFVSEFFSGAC